jgi:UDP-N-acetylglucosamine 2-epimerase (non-hydrolysing)
MSGVSKENVFRSINYVCKNFKNFQRDKVQDYLTENASDKLIKVILSYTDLVNKRIWFKE